MNNKICVAVSGDELMISFDPMLRDKFWGDTGFRNGEKVRIYKGMDTSIDTAFIRKPKHLAFCIQQSLDFNPRAKESVKRKKQ